MSELMPCGSFAAYMRHKRAGEPVDELCAQAARDQKNERVAAGLEKSAAVVAAAVADAPPIDSVDELEDLRDNLRIVTAALTSGAPHNTIAALSKRRQELVHQIVVLERSSKPEMSAIDQLAQRRAERLARTAV